MVAFRCPTGEFERLADKTPFQTFFFCYSIIKKATGGKLVYGKCVTTVECSMHETSKC